MRPFEPAPGPPERLRPDASLEGRGEAMGVANGRGTGDPGHPGPPGPPKPGPHQPGPPQPGPPQPGRLRPRRLWLALAAVAVLAVGVAAFVATGTSQPGGTPQEQLRQWASGTGLGGEIGTLRADNARISRVVAEHRGSGAVHADCGALYTDTESANTELPAPDQRLTNVLSEAYTLEGSGGQRLLQRRLVQPEPPPTVRARAGASADPPVRGRGNGRPGHRAVGADHHDDPAGLGGDLRVNDPAQEVTPPVPAGRDPVEYDRLRRRVLWSMPTGLYVVGSRAEIGGEVRWNLMTANLVVQVSVVPKLLAVSVETGAVTCTLVRAGGAFSVCLLDRDDRAARTAVRQAGRRGADRSGRPRRPAGG